MRVLFLTEAGSQDVAVKHRVDFVSEELARRGYTTKVLYGGVNLGGRLFRTTPLSGFLAVLRKDWDVVIIARSGSLFSVLTAAVCRALNQPVVFDFDDALYEFKFKNTSVGTIPNPSQVFFDQVIAAADVVTTSSDYLINYAKQYNDDVVKLPTPVNTNLFNEETTSEKSYQNTVIGWGGDGTVHGDTLGELVEPLQRLAEEYDDLTFKIVNWLGNEKIKDQFRRLERDIEIDYGSSNWEPVESFAQEISTFDIAALPLNRRGENLTELFEGKSGMKVFEHQALGIPVVASDFGEYSDIIDHGETGLLADSADEWYQYLRYLIEDSSERERLGRKGQQHVMQKYSVEAYVDKLEPILGDLAERKSNN